MHTILSIVSRTPWQIKIEHILLIINNNDYNNSLVIFLQLAAHITSTVIEILTRKLFHTRLKLKLLLLLTTLVNPFRQGDKTYLVFNLFNKIFDRWLAFLFELSKTHLTRDISSTIASHLSDICFSFAILRQVYTLSRRGEEV